MASAPPARCRGRAGRVATRAACLRALRLRPLRPAPGQGPRPGCTCLLPQSLARVGPGWVNAGGLGGALLLCACVFAVVVGILGVRGVMVRVLRWVVCGMSVQDDAFVADPVGLKSLALSIVSRQRP